LTLEHILMSSTKKYALEYWINLDKFSKEQLEDYVKESLNKFLANIKFEVQEKDRYLILLIVSTEKIIDSCHDKLNFDREWSFRAKDELGDSLRLKAYPILAEIELSLRSFIQQAMINVLGFDWWNSFIPEDIREKVKIVEAKAGNYQVKSHHPIELTFFEDLIGIVTTKVQAWSPNHAITVSDFCELLTMCSSVEEMQQEVNNRSKVLSFWDNIFSDYFDDKDSWIRLKEDIKKLAIPLRNKVMHHRLIRYYELQPLENLKNRVKQVISLSKTTLSDAELERIKPSVKIITDKVRPQFNAAIMGKDIPRLNIDPELLENLGRVMKSAFDQDGRPKLNIDPEDLGRVMKLASDQDGKPKLNIDPKLLENLGRVMKSAFDQDGRPKLNIDPEDLGRVMKLASDQDGRPKLNIDPELHSSQKALDDNKNQDDNEN
jgi:hypothetical protein